MFRSKSRSVDHGISAPYDLEALRAKVDGQFDRSLEKGECFIYILEGITWSFGNKSTVYNVLRQVYDGYIDLHHLI